MQRINKLILKNFKFFYGDVAINLNRKHILLYGENGSGKSSMYWALYTFLQSVFKTDNLEIRKYFDPRHEENLINRYASDIDESAIIIEFEDEHKASSRREISLSTINTKSDNLVKETALGSDFIDHKVLSRIYAYYHKEDIDLFDFFNHHLFASINFREDLIKPGDATGSKNAETWWEYFEKGINPKPKMHEQVYVDFQQFIVKFNSELKYYLEVIEQLTNDYLRDRFEEKFKIKFEYKNGTYNDFKKQSKGRTWEVKPPKILLSVYLISDLISNPAKKKVTSPQSFLNEAKLSSLALAMRMAILDEKYVSAYPKILVLDDLLMSMDMSNREFVLGMILENYTKDYQIVFFTHQRGLFEDARKFIETYHSEQSRKEGETNLEARKNACQKHWLVYEMYETENDKGIPIPSMQPFQSSLQKALKYFRSPIDYNACGNSLRIALEEFFRGFLPPRYFVDADGNPKPANSLMLEALLVKAREYFNYVGFDTTPLDKLDRYRVRSLNPSSHFNPETDYFKKEIQEIFRIIDNLYKHRNDPILGPGRKVKFTIATNSGNTFEYTATLLDDIKLYKKNDSGSSFFMPTDERGFVIIGCTENNTMTSRKDHEINRCTLQSLYDDTVAYINRTDVAIVENDMFEVFTDENGHTLNSLKSY